MKKKLKKCKKQAQEQQKKSIKKKVKKLRKKLKKLKKDRKKETRKLKKKVITQEKQKPNTANHIKSDSSKDKGSKPPKIKTDVIENGSSSVGPSVEMMTTSQATTPMTREEWEKQESVMRRVYDQDSGRHR